MGLLNIAEMIQIVRKFALRILALSLAAGLAGACFAAMTQTYTC